MTEQGLVYLTVLAFYLLGMYGTWRGADMTGDCGHDTTQDHEWPGNDGRTICYRCFEVEADESWWEMLSILPE